MRNLLEPWVALRLVAGLVSTLLLLRASYTGIQVLRHFKLARATEGQLLLERRLELSATFVRIGSIVQMASVAFTALAAERLSHGIRGAMCGYGVFQASAWGFRSLAADVALALVAGLFSQLFAFDARVKSFALAKPLAWAMVVLGPLAVGSFALAVKFFTDLDLTVVASCCSVTLDAGAGVEEARAFGPRVPTTIAAVVAVCAALGVGLLAARRPARPRVVLAGALSIAAFPLAIAAVMLEVAPHAFEVPQHVCPFCLLKADVLAIGYPLFGAIFLAAIWGGGAALASLFAKERAAHDAFGPFAKKTLGRAGLAWGVVLVLAAAPVLRYAIVSGFTPLFP